MVKSGRKSGTGSACELSGVRDQNISLTLFTRPTRNIFIVLLVLTVGGFFKLFLTLSMSLSITNEM